MDPIVIASICALVGAIITAALSVRTGRGQQSQIGADNFRDDLLARIEQQNGRITQLEARCDRLQGDNAELHAHIFVLKEWGRWSQQPVPREPPPWHPEIHTPR